jgi:hypothetical protein
MLADALAFLAAFIRTHVHEICFGITAVTLTLAGPKINGGLKQIVRKLNWLLRYAAFVVLCTAGYTFLSQIIYRGLLHLLHGLTNLMLVLVTLGLYLLLAWVAKEQKVI